LRVGAFEERRVAAPDRFSRKHDLVPALDQRRPMAGRVLACVPGLREGSGSVAVQPLSDFERSLDLCQVIERPAPEVCRALVELESRTFPVLREVGVIGRLRKERKHDQVDRCCLRSKKPNAGWRSRCINQEKDLLEESHEKASNHRNNAHWQRDALRSPFISAFLARDCRFGRARYRGCPGRAAGDARQRCGCGAQSFTALRRWRYLPLSCAA
jgi:hypothetical protein